MTNPAEASARDEAERRGYSWPGSDVDRIEADLLAETADDEPAAGAWLLGEYPATPSYTPRCPAHLLPEPCQTCGAYIAAGL